MTLSERDLEIASELVNLLDFIDCENINSDNLIKGIAEALASERRKAWNEALTEAASIFDLSIRAFESETLLRDLDKASLLKVIQKEILELKESEKQ